MLAWKVIIFCWINFAECAKEKTTESFKNSLSTKREEPFKMDLWRTIMIEDPETSNTSVTTDNAYFPESVEISKRQPTRISTPQSKKEEKFILDNEKKRNSEVPFLQGEIGFNKGCTSEIGEPIKYVPVPNAAVGSFLIDHKPPHSKLDFRRKFLVEEFHSLHQSLHRTVSSASKCSADRGDGQECKYGKTGPNVESENEETPMRRKHSFSNFVQAQPMTPQEQKKIIKDVNKIYKEYISKEGFVKEEREKIRDICMNILNTVCGDGPDEKKPICYLGEEKGFAKRLSSKMNKIRIKSDLVSAGIRTECEIFSDSDDSAPSVVTASKSSSSTNSGWKKVRKVVLGSMTCCSNLSVISSAKKSTTDADTDSMQRISPSIMEVLSSIEKSFTECNPGDEGFNYTFLGQIKGFDDNK